MDIFQKIASVFKWHALMCLKSFPILYFPSNKIRVTRSRCSNELYKRFR